MFLLAAALEGSPARGEALLSATPIPLAKFKVAEYRLGQLCATRFGTCRIRPRPTNTQCYCGRISGVVR
jgi:hypothetical protein